uniref:Uncharacterized protein n=1 Tax=Noccaea caerulescens TaxID=107243 RepID=A0A1J3ICT7_NOCCA
MNRRHPRTMKKIPWPRSPPTWLYAMKKPETIPSVPNTRRATASAISLTGGRLLTVYEVSIMMSSSVIENAWSTYAIYTAADPDQWKSIATDLEKTRNEVESA